LANHAHAVRERFQYAISPAGRDDGRRLLVHGLIRFGEETHVLARGRSCEFLHGDSELDVAVRLLFLHREKTQLRQFLRAIFLRVMPFAHRVPPAKNRKWRASSSNTWIVTKSCADLQRHLRPRAAASQRAAVNRIGNFVWRRTAEILSLFYGVIAENATFQCPLTLLEKWCEAHAGPKSR